MSHEIIAQPIYNKKGKVVSASIKLCNANLTPGTKYTVTIL